MPRLNPEHYDFSEPEKLDLEMTTAKHTYDKPGASAAKQQENCCF